MKVIITHYLFKHSVWHNLLQQIWDLFFLLVEFYDSFWLRVVVIVLSNFSLDDIEYISESEDPILNICKKKTFLIVNYILWDELHNKNFSCNYLKPLHKRSNNIHPTTGLGFIQSRIKIKKPNEVLLQEIDRNGNLTRANVGSFLVEA